MARRQTVEHKSGRNLRRSKMIVGCALSACIAVSVTQIQANPAVEKFETNYDKGRSLDGQTVQNSSRTPLWDDPAMVGTVPDEETMGTRDKERGQTGVNGEGDINANSLTGFSDRVTANPEYQELYRRVMSLGYTMGESDYGHEGHISNLEDRVSTLEDQPYNWEEQPPSGGAYEPVGSASYNSWEPAISNQKADFTQTRSGTQDYQRTVNVYETNTATGEQRLVDTYTESETRPTEETRAIDVANNPNGGADGWSSWSNTGSIYNCGGWSPSTSTVNQGQRFTQYQDCSQNQERFIYYLTSGSVIEQNRGTRTVTVTRSRSATGTKQTGVWEANRAPTAADLRNLGRTSDPVGSSCGPIGREIVHESPGPQTGSTIRIVFRCVKP